MFQRRRIRRRDSVLAVGLFSFVVTLQHCTEASHQPFGLQAGNGVSSSFATSMIYNEQNHEIAITGATIGNYFQPTLEEDQINNSTLSDCFVAILRLPRKDASGQLIDPDQLSWIRRRQYGTSTAHEFCSDLLWNGGNIVAIGHTAGQQGLLTSLLPHGNNRRQVYGTILDLDSAVELQGGMLLHSNQVQFPLAIARDNKDQNSMYVVDLFSEYNKVSVADLDDRELFPERTLIQDGPWKDANFAVRVQKIRQNQSRGEEEMTFASVWMRQFGTMNQENVMVSSLVMIGDRLVMTGYTAGSSSAFGESTHGESPDGSGLSSVVDSFLSVIDPETGDLWKVLRVKADETANHRTMHLCHQEMTNNVDGSAETVSNVYLVGTTELTSQNTDFAFVQQVNLATMELGWKQEIRGTLYPPTDNPEDGAKVHAISCIVTDDGKDVYVAGNVMDGSVLSREDDQRHLRQSNDNRNSSGDIFVARFDALDGTMAYSREIGSDQNDAIAPGKSLATDGDGNLIVLANTMGSLYHQNVSPEGSSEIIVFSIGRAEGDFFLPHPRSKDHEPIATTESSTQDVQPKWLYAVISFTIVVVAAVASLLWQIYRRPRRKEYRSGLYEYEGIWRTATYDPDTEDGDRLVIRGQYRDSGREQRYWDIDRARRISTINTTKFPLGAFSKTDGGDLGESTGDVYDLLALASKRHSKVLAEDQARARARLAAAVRAATSYDEDDIPDISK
ncbi:hypothetical protein IV203_005595 [Nitzschia inconspicua]|uniref:Uncharacterized protein n=1 Tax=Nitzschia inconspicua TaxID=303405 RepID=A0A9K3PG70_9STRA|nr:hypothetical protein IV203_005595 [Nitzschia inconspicua]